MSPPQIPDPRPQAVALISGGKDSFLSLTHAIHNNYRIVALCNLHPPLLNQSNATTLVRPDDPVSLGASPASTSDELDSYMYQTIGHTVLPLYSRALGLPLYRHPIVGKAVDVNLNYHPASSTTNTSTDETEDLYALLSTVKRDFPAISAVTSGAILSSYQRTRVESVCRRLGLISLAYLWQLPQPSILSALSQLEWDARIVKVAALGMDEKWLWWNLADPAIQRRLNVLRMKWGINVAGEGGEFESLVVATPGWRGRIVVEDEKRKVVKEEEGGGAVWVQFDEATVEISEKAEGGQENWAKGLDKPPLLDDEFMSLLPHEPTPFTPPSSASSTPAWSGIFTQDSPKVSASTTTTNPSTQIITISNLTGSNPSDLLTRLFSLIPKSAVITSIHISLPNIALFPVLNAAYTPFFPLPLPPSRVCIASPGLSTNSSDLIVCHATAANLTPDSDSDYYCQTGLHVQSRSYWAPSNIGPYSQATLTPSGLWWDIAGQIPLVPSSMKLLPRDEGVETAIALAMQHLARITHAVDEQAEVKGCVVYVNVSVVKSDKEMVEKLVRVLEEWKNGIQVLVVGAAGLPMDAAIEVVGTVASSRNSAAMADVIPHGIVGGMNGSITDLTKCTTDDLHDTIVYVDVDWREGGELGKDMIKSGVRVVPVKGIWGRDGARLGAAGWRRVAGSGGGPGGYEDSDSD